MRRTWWCTPSSETATACPVLDTGCPTGYEQSRVLKESLEQLPAGVSKSLPRTRYGVMMRSDSAGYQKELLRYCAEGRDERFGVIEFCVGVDVMPEFKAAVKEVGEDGWHDLHGREEVSIESAQASSTPRCAT